MALRTGAVQAREGDYFGPPLNRVARLLEAGHGAFTLALLRSLDKLELGPTGVLHFSALAYAVAEEVACLMIEAGRNESEQEPCVPLAPRWL